MTRLAHVCLKTALKCVPPTARMRVLVAVVNSMMAVVVVNSIVAVPVVNSFVFLNVLYLSIVKHISNEICLLFFGKPSFRKILKS